MILNRSVMGHALRSGLIRQAYGSGSESVRPFNALSGFIENSETNIESSILGNISTRLGLGSVNVSSPYSMMSRSFIHSGKQAEAESGTMPRSMDYVQGLFHENSNPVPGRPMYSSPGLLHENANPVPGRPMYSSPGFFQESGYGFGVRRPFFQPPLEKNADIVHIKLMRNNAFVTLTDSKGNKKKGISAAKLAGKGGKLARYSGEAAAENMGREVRRMKTKSVVVKVNGYTFFRKKKDAILGFKDGYTNSRADVSPIVYIEDTTRKPHNGCRRRKQRRI